MIFLCMIRWPSDGRVNLTVQRLCLRWEDSATVQCRLEMWPTTRLRHTYIIYIRLHCARRDARYTGIGKIPRYQSDGILYAVGLFYFCASNFIKCSAASCCIQSRHRPPPNPQPGQGLTGVKGTDHGVKRPFMLVKCLICRCEGRVKWLQWNCPRQSRLQCRCTNFMEQSAC